MLEETEDESDNIYGTQPIEEVDIQIYREIKNQLGQQPKESFIECLVQKYDDINELNEVRKSMYDYAKSQTENFPGGFLTERRQRGKSGKPVCEKYAADVYYLYAFVEGIVSSDELQKNVMSKHKMKNANISQCDDSQELNEVSGLALQDILKHVNCELAPIHEELQELKTLFQSEIKSRNHEIMLLRAENERLQTELSNNILEKCRISVSDAQLKSEIRYLKQNLKSCEEENKNNGEIMLELKKIQKQTEMKHNKIQTKQTDNTKQKNIPEQINEPKETQANVTNKQSYAEKVSHPKVLHHESKNNDVEKPACDLQSERLTRRETTVRGNSATTNSFTGYKFVHRRRTPIKRVVLANIKARGTSFETVKADLIEWCESRNVRASGIFLLAHHSERKLPTFVIRANIDATDYEKTCEPNFWPDSISVREWIIRENNGDSPGQTENP